MQKKPLKFKRFGDSSQEIILIALSSRTVINISKIAYLYTSCIFRVMPGRKQLFKRMQSILQTIFTTACISTFLTAQIHCLSKKLL